MLILTELTSFSKEIILGCEFSKMMNLAERYLHVLYAQKKPAAGGGPQIQIRSAQNPRTRGKYLLIGAPLTKASILIGALFNQAFALAQHATCNLIRALLN
jgi:hypothetical protein